MKQPLPAPPALPARAACLGIIAWLTILLAVLAGHPGGAAPAAPGPRPLTAAEREAVALAAEYLAGGAPAWLQKLSRGSPLRRLRREDALAEIEVRAGPAAGTRWEMQTTPAAFAQHGAVFLIDFPSGVDDTLALGLVEEEGSWKIDWLRTGAEPDPDALGPPAGPAAAGAAPAPSRHVPGFVWIVLAAVAAAAALALLVASWLLRRRAAPAIAATPRAGAGAAYRRGPNVSPAALAAAGVALLALASSGLWFGLTHAGVAVRGAAETAAAGARAATSAAHAGELRSLLPLRRALSQVGGGELTPATAAAGPAPAAGTAEAVALLWRAQRLLLGSSDLDGADAILRRFPLPGRVPLAELLRARLGLLRLQEMDAGIAYERALTLGVRHEGLLLEAAQALYILGFEDHAKRYLRELEQLGARAAEPYYDLAETAAIEHHTHEAIASFRTAWRLRPVERGVILDSPLLAELLRDREVRTLLNLGEVAEPAPVCAAAGSRALDLPPGIDADLLGEVLRLRAGSAELTVPGGCDLAPPATRPESAADWNRQRQAAALARLPELMAGARSGGALAQPAVRRQTEEAATALAKRQRWNEIIDLTAPLAPPSSILPPRLTRLRAAALRRRGRKEEARQLLLRLAMGDKAAHRPDPAALYELADLMASAGDFDAAIKLVVKADSERPTPPRNERVLQLQMERRLASASAVRNSPHFAIRYPSSRGEPFAREVGRILEAERLRLQKWIPVGAAGERVGVHLLPYEDFELAYSRGGYVLGTFDELIRVPLGSVARFAPFIVAILSHELAHALIAQRTDGRAPHWLHEGLARHVQMVQEQVNPIADYRLHGLLLSFPLIEPALQGFASPEWTSAAYDEAQWTMHYVETRYGVAGIHRLLDAYRAGKTTEEALASAFNTDPTTFDRETWDWCTTRAPRAWKTQLVHYELDEESGEGLIRSRPH